MTDFSYKTFTTDQADLWGMINDKEDEALEEIEKEDGERREEEKGRRRRREGKKKWRGAKAGGGGVTPTER